MGKSQEYVFLSLFSSEIIQKTKQMDLICLLVDVFI